MGSFFHPMWPHTLELSVVPPQIAPAALTYLPVSTPLDSMQCIRLSRTTSILWHRIGMEGSRLVTFPAANIRLFRNFFLFSAHPCSTGLHIFSFTLSFVAFSQGLRLLLLFDFVTVQFSDIYILPYIFDTLFRKPCHLTSHQVSDRHEVHTCCSIPQCRTFISYTLIKIMNNAGKMMIVISDS